MGARFTHIPLLACLTELEQSHQNSRKPPPPNATRLRRAQLPLHTKGIPNWFQNDLGPVIPPPTLPNIKKKTVGVKRPFSELSECSMVFSEQLSESRQWFSECEIPFLEWHLTTWAIRKPQFSEQLPERFPELMGTHMKDSIGPTLLEHYFQELGWPQHARLIFLGVRLISRQQSAGLLGSVCHGLCCWFDSVSFLIFPGYVASVPRTPRTLPRWFQNMCPVRQSVTDQNFGASQKRL